MDYHLRSLGRVCSATGKPLAPGRRCHSALVERDGQLVRLDFSTEGWSGPPEGTVGHWMPLVPEQSAAKQRPLDPESLLRCFEQMNEDASPATEKMRYVLALLLLQRRRLQLTDTTEDDGETWMEVTGSKGEGPWLVRKLEIDDAEFESIQQNVAGLMALETDADSWNATTEPVE